ncbi:MAG: non-histone chromosomal MC1 family protein [Halobacteriota archaeon]|nr:non-histone chromosomal MC1 family protein [Halobacteriota archaeon]MDY6958665.1 non-histone chromosomal MC1 family protein [Halobacteriota archaeon]
MAETEKRYFALRNPKTGKETGTYMGRSPRQAALKAANRGVKNIHLRERGTLKVHMYTGTRKKVKAPANRPSWMPADIYKPNVKKNGIKKLKKI